MSNYRDVGKAVGEGVKNPPDKALELVRLRRIIKLVDESKRRQVFIALGTIGDYFLIPSLFCSCKDFELNVVMRGSKGTCYHLIALELALREGKVRDVLVSDEEFMDIVYEVLFEGRSQTLRKILMRKSDPVEVHH